MTSTTEVFVVTQPMILAVTVGIVLCSLLCVIAAMRDGGKRLERFVPITLCEFYLALCGFYCLYTAAGSFLTQTVGFLLLALGLAPIFLRKVNFQMARICIAGGATLAACAVLLLG